MVAVLASLAVEFNHPPDAWRRMPWVEFQAWVAELGRRADARAMAERDAQQAQEISRQRRSGGW